MKKSKKGIRSQLRITQPVPKRKDAPYEYLPADEYVVFHEFLEGLDTIKILLPKPPDLKTIEGYGLDPLDQKFQYTILPPKLEALNSKNYLNVEDYWNEIEGDFEYFEDELWFIEQEWKRRKFGHWVFIKGKPTWISPWHYLYLNYYDFINENDGSAHPEYRDCDRKLFIGRWYAATTTEAPFKYKYWKGDSKPKYTSSDKYIRELKDAGYTVESNGYMLDMGTRTCLGTIEFKKRRAGYTSQCSAISIDIATRMKRGDTALQSMTEESAKKIFTKYIVRGFKGMPFFFKPISENIVDPEKSMKFKPALKKTHVEKKQKIVKALYSEMTFGSSAVGYFDGSKLKYWLSDEFSKVTEISVLERALVVRKTMTTGDMKNIHGYSNQISTAGEMKKGGGSEAKKMAQLSHWGQRNDIGQTDTGYINLFIPSDEGLEGFVDEWGYSLKDEAREHIMSKRRSLIEKGAWEELNEDIRQTPLTWKENFISNNKQARFNIYILEKRIAELTVGVNPFVMHGRFAWEKNSTHNYELKKLPSRQQFINGLDRVIWIPQTPYDFDWEISYMPDPKSQNKIIFDENENKIIPGNISKFAHGVDVFKYGQKTTSGAGSLGAGNILRLFDPMIDLPHLDPLGINPKTGDFNHVTNRFCGVYLKRPRLEEFLEQQLMAALFYGHQINPEMNLKDMYRWAKDRGFPEYMFYEVDIITGDEKKEPGAHTTINMINTIFNAWAQHIDMNGMREVHAVPLIQCAEIDDSMNDFDSFTGGGYALLQAGAMRPVDIEVHETFDYSQIFQFETLD